MQRNRLQYKTRHPYRPFVRYDVFAGAMPPKPARLIGAAETFEQLPLLDVTQPDIKTNIKNFSRTRKQRVREFVYEPYEDAP